MSVATQPIGAHGAAHEVAHAEEHGHSYAFTERNNRLVLWLFIISDALLFGGLLVARFYLWGNTRPQVDQFIGLMVTIVLLLSSVSMYTAESAIAKGNRRLFLSLLILTAVLGTAFLAGVMVFEWGLFPSLYEGHLTPGENVYGAVVFAMTGMHALHVISGVIFILIVWNLGRKGHFSPERHWGVEACASYWHYVDVVWIFFYPAIYLIGVAAH